jgi:hypothetical protein
MSTSKVSKYNNLDDNIIMTIFKWKLDFSLGLEFDENLN